MPKMYMGSVTASWHIIKKSVYAHYIPYIYYDIMLIFSKYYVYYAFYHCISTICCRVVDMYTTKT